MSQLILAQKKNFTPVKKLGLNYYNLKLSKDYDFIYYKIFIFSYAVIGKISNEEDCI